jgi:phospholipase C
VNPLDSDSALSRREFLERSAYLAGIAGAATVLPASGLIAEAAKAQAAPLPAPANVPIDHFVIVMMENRSFDHYFGWLSEVADGIQQQSYPNPSGDQVPTQHASELEAQWQGCGHPDPGHGWESGRAQLNGGFLADGSGNDEFALSYYNEGELGFIHPAGKEFTLYDRFFCSLLGPTWPNRYYKWSAQSGGKKDNSPPVGTAGNQWETIFDRALANNPLNIPGDGLLTANYYNSDLPFAAVWGARGVSWTRPIAEFYADCAAGTLPNISIVDPPFLDGGGGDGLSADEHPHGDVRLGQAWMSDVAHAFMSSPNYRRGAMFIIYDEWGGFFDHVRPPSVPDDRSSIDLNEDFGQMGFRIPAVAISPYARNPKTADCARARVNHTQLGHESILKLISYRFGLGNLVTRDAMANNIGESFNWSATDLEPPDLPDPAAIVTSPCSLGGDTNRDLPAELRIDHERDLQNLHDLAVRHGYEIGDGKVDSIFSEPDTIKKAAAEAAVADAAAAEARAADPACEPGKPSSPPSGQSGPVALGTSAASPPHSRRKKRKRRKKKRRKRG